VYARGSNKSESRLGVCELRPRSALTVARALNGLSYVQRTGEYLGSNPKQSKVMKGVNNGV
jgi:hypothetical protein